MITNKDKAIAYKILSLIENNPVKMFSWGFTDPTVIENGLLFKVRGLKHKGKVKVLYQEGKDLFQIQLFSKKNKLKDSIEDVYVDQLVQVIDQSVEKIENYNEVVRAMYGLPPKKYKSIGDK